MQVMSRSMPNEATDPAANKLNVEPKTRRSHQCIRDTN